MRADGLQWFAIRDSYQCSRLPALPSFPPAANVAPILNWRQ